MDRPCRGDVRGLPRDAPSALWPGVPASAFSAAGWNNNRLFVIPGWDLVVVRLGRDQAEGFVITNAVWAEFLGRLGAATRSASDPR
jgi:hypothetical protein